MSQASASAFRSITGDLVIDQLCNEFEDAWKAGQTPQIEEFLARADTRWRFSLLRELFAIEFHHRSRTGDTIPLEAYRERFPELTDELLASIVAESGRFEVDADTAAFAGDSSIDASESNRTQPARRGGRMPAQLGDYEVLDEIARGGMGVVYKARQARLNRIVALKMILAGEHADPEQLERFKREASALAQLQHPNIVQIHEVNEHDGHPYFSLEFVEGGSLARKLADSPLPAKEAADLVEILARAVHAAHEKGIIHRDLKPANVLLTQNGTPKITDFGLARQIKDEGRTRTGVIMGTPSYMAPEQASGAIKELGPLVDVYALGAMLYEMLTGRPPFKGSTLLDTLEQVRTQEPVPPSCLQPGTPRDLETICLKCLQKEPSRRYASAEALADDVRRFLDGRPIKAQPVTRSEMAWRWCKRNPVAAGLTALVVLLGIAVTALSAFSAIQSRIAARDLKKERDDKEQERIGAVAARDRARGVLETVASEEALETLSREPKLTDQQRSFLENMVGYYREYAAEAPATPDEQRRQARAYAHSTAFDCARRKCINLRGGSGRYEC